MSLAYGHLVSLRTTKVGKFTDFMHNLNFSQQTVGIAEETIFLRKYIANMRCITEQNDGSTITVQLLFETEEELGNFVSGFNSINA